MTMGEKLIKLSRLLECSIDFLLKNAGTFFLLPL